MAYVNSDLVQKFQKAFLAHKRQEGDGLETQVEVREDEEQSVKLQEIIDVLVAAGYYRARIKGLSPFDKVVGGMTWCIESLNADVDVDLLFQENSTIGQQISLAEKIVVVLPKLKCPHFIEPHQIQGLDFIHIFPVIQWLVKASKEARAERAAFVRSYSVRQFGKNFPNESQTDQVNRNILENVRQVDEFYRPHRLYKRKGAPPPDVLSRVETTLLEYDFRKGQKSKQVNLEKVGEEGAAAEVEEELEEKLDEEKHIEELMTNLTRTMGDILHDSDLTDQDKGALIKHYKGLYSELQDGGAQSKEEQQVAILEERNRIIEVNLSQLEERKKHLLETIEAESRLLEETRIKQQEVQETLHEFEEEENRNPSVVKEIEDLVILNDSLKSKEAKFKENCRKELAKLQKEIGEFKEILSPVELSPEQVQEIEQLTEKLRLVRLELAKKNQIVAKLQRQLDDVPNRAEMAQYQRRFLELYNQVAAKHKETKQYYTLYNTLNDKKRYMQKELSLLNSVAENYPMAMQSQSGKEEFLNQFRSIVDGVRHNRLKIDKQVADEKKKRDSLAGSLQNLLELQRAYASAIRQLSLECKNYETLLARKRRDV